MNHVQRVFTAAIATGIALTAALTPAKPARAADLIQYSTNRLIEIGVNPTIAHAVEAAGVPVFEGDESFAICDPSSGFTTYGAYFYSHNAIVMCVNNLPNRYEFVETFYHETVHLTQDCRAGLYNSVLETAGSEIYIQYLWDRLPVHKQDNIIRSYDHTDWDVEIEAFFFETRPQEVKEMLINACF